uniref:Uncharacterized protein n=1 Tax=Candidatus Methanogaster sp. ANME-2c ERB4 TaxID=2759911 RepID=A0A7G9Y2U3_9EURY|nr:hypothetical protein KODGCDNG_00014 [Methanosarcinales archaeon ANME-2c ERB4]QNO43036.1 hypothetical protein HGKCJMEE_00014 [Methanosarcinales archaeon ANME-2c ERB4]QNO43214.1 hypothetical protein IMGOGGGD_00014 [Methanosarcinales archaeon ANME-2c ERB4]QNO45539.1 hypothetical protein MALFCOLD_00014 [Methanosarcinales archaeon ANME-2c ERB4]
MISFWSVRVSANPAAKIAHGTRDSLLTNGVAQAAKAKILIYIYPANQYEGAVTAILPDGAEMTLVHAGCGHRKR